MTYDPKYNGSHYRYMKEKWKRVPLDLEKKYYSEVVLPAANAAGVGVNTYIKTALREKIERENKKSGG